MKTGAIKIIAASMSAGMFILLVFIVPVHLAELESHDNCEICQFIQHTPLLEAETAADIVLIFQTEGRVFISYASDFPCPQLRNFLSRAPPLL